MTLHYRSLPDLTGIDLAPSLTLGSLTPVQSPAPARPAYSVAGRQGYAQSGKRLLDVVLASVALVLSAPVLLLLIVALWIEGGQPIFTQDRVGRNGRVFRMFKLRSMVVDAEARLAEYLDADPRMRAEWELTQKLKRDPRITPLGRLLRITSLDEVPQLINVLRGDMSLVGPRPMLPEQMPLYRHLSAYLGLRPGLTGLWQVTARNEESFDLRAAIDLAYAQRVSLWRDLKIMAATLVALGKATGY